MVRVKVKKCDGSLPVEFRSFAVDPQITSLEVLQHILIRAFDLNGKRNFGMSYLSRDRSGSETYLSLLSDWDLDVAFVSAAKPHLQLKVDIKPSEDSPVMEDWDIISPKDVIGSEQLFVERTKSLASAALPFTQSLLSQVGKTLSKVQQAFTWSYGEEIKPFKPPLSDAEFHDYLNELGQLTRPEELRLRIYHGGVEPSLRKVVWRYLLNVYPDGLSGQERMDYMKRKTREYEQLKREWVARVTSDDLDFIRGNVLKDVLRTDRAHPYYAGSEDSPHLAALTDLLTTFAITHPQISYCQGMSDIASPILAVMDNEAHAFICFCGIMKRLEGNFRPDGQLMSVKFQHLKLLLQYSDPDFYSYLVSRGADDLFFCYRWLLLDLKREFAFDDALRMLEVTWSSLPPDPPETEVELLGAPLAPVEAASRNNRDGRIVNGFGGDADHKRKQRLQHMLRPPREDSAESGSPERSGVELNAAREGSYRAVPLTGPHQADLTKSPFERQTSFGEFKYYTARREDSFEMNADEQPKSSVASEPVSSVPRRQSTVESEDDAGEQTPLITDCEDGLSPASAAPLFLSGLSVWRSAPSASPVSPGSSQRSPATAGGGTGGEASAQSVPQALTSSAQVLCSPGIPPARGAADSPSHSQSQSLLQSPVLTLGRGPLPLSMPTSSRSESSSTSSVKPCSLPPPQEFGKGNPFMLFLCLSILLEHRDHIIKNGLDYNELAMHFDRLVRRHQLARVLQRAKALFADYLQSEVWDSEEGDEVSLDSPTSTCTTISSSAAAAAVADHHSAQPVRSPVASPRTSSLTLSSPRSTYNLATTIPSPTAAAVGCVSPSP